MALTIGWRPAVGICMKSTMESNCPVSVFYSVFRFPVRLHIGNDRVGNRQDIFPKLFRCRNL